MDLKNKTAIITGAGRGIGKAVALNLAKEGCNVVLISRTKNELEKTAREVESKGAKALVLPFDLRNFKNIELIISETIKKFKSINILINNAAVLFQSDFLETTEEEWDMTMDINLKSTWMLSQKVMKMMIEKKEGYIINIASVGAIEIPARLAAYGISKVGVIGLNDVLYEVGKTHGVKVSVVYPGMTDTEMLREGVKPNVSREKWMSPDDLASCILFLLKQSDRVVVKSIVAWARQWDKV